MTEYYDNKLRSRFVHNSLQKDVALTIERVNEVVASFGRCEYHMVHLIKDEISSSIEHFVADLHTRIHERIESQQLREATTGSRRTPHFICGEPMTVDAFIKGYLKSEFTRTLPRGGIDPNSVTIAPPAVLVGVSVLDKALDREVRVAQPLNNDHTALFAEHVNAMKLPLAKAFVNAASLFITPRYALDDEEVHSYLREFVEQSYSGVIPSRLPSNPKTLSDYLALELNARLKARAVA